MNPMSTSAMVEVLTPIWQQVLGLPVVGIDDNFFDIGGDSALALQLFDEIARKCGRELPPVMIYHAPTISALAALLEEAAPRVPAMVQLKEGSAAPPIFIAHGLGGSVMDFYQIVKRMETSRPIFGLQAKGIDGIEEPLDRIEDMAQYSLEAVRQVQPHGPYHFIGFSLGGLVALEMAQQLVIQGERIGLLAMLDSYPHVSCLSTSQRCRLWARQTWRRAIRRMQWLGVNPPFETILDVAPPASLQRFRDCSYVALGRYKPRFYPGKINFVKAAIRTDFPGDPIAVWSHLANEFDLDSAPGDHLGMMTTHFGDLASVISKYLAQSE